MVPKETFASNISLPPETFLILLIMLYMGKKERERKEVRQ